MNPVSTSSFSVDAPHALSADEALDRLQSRREGLTAAEAAQRLESVGPNRLPVPPRDGPLKRFFKHFNDVLIYILLSAAVITALLGHWIDTGVILGVVVINAIIGFIQEGKAEQALEGIRKMLSPHAHVRRDGEWTEIEAEDLVPGDLVRLRSGDRVPADLRLIEAVNLRIEESALTGESVPSEKNVEPVARRRRRRRPPRHGLFGHDGRRRSRRGRGHRHRTGTETRPHQPDDRRSGDAGHAADPPDGGLRQGLVRRDRGHGRRHVPDRLAAARFHPTNCSWPPSASPSRRFPRACRRF